MSSAKNRAPISTNDLKKEVLNEFNKNGEMNKIRAQLRSKVIEALEAKKKKSFGAAAKYMTGSLISSPITHKVVQHPDGLLCAEIIREFMNFYKMNLSL